MTLKEKRMQTTRELKAILVESQGPDFRFEESGPVLVFDFKKDGVVYEGLEYHRGNREVFNPIMRWVEGHGDNTKYDAYEAIVDMLNDELQEIKIRIEERAFFEKINKGLGLQK